MAARSGIKSRMSLVLTYCIIIAAQPACAFHRLLSPQTASLSWYSDLEAPPLPVQLNANNHQSPLLSPLSSSSFMCLLVPCCWLNQASVFARGSSRHSTAARPRKQTGADQMSAHLSFQCNLTPSTEVKDTFRTETQPPSSKHQHASHPNAHILSVRLMAAHGQRLHVSVHVTHKNYRLWCPFTCSQVRFHFKNMLHDLFPLMSEAFMF